MVADIADAQPVLPGFHQQAKDRKAGIMAKGGKGAGGGAGAGHVANITIFLVL